MKGSSQYHQLVNSHRWIDEKLSAEMERPMPDSMTIQRLKRRKLAIRDDIESWERLMSVIGGKPAGNTA